MKNKLALSLLAGVFFAVPVLAQPAIDPNLPKFPTPPPKVTAEDSIINPPYADAPEYKVDPSVPAHDTQHRLPLNAKKPCLSQLMPICSKRPEPDSTR